MEKLNVCLLNDSFPPAIDGVANAVTNYARIITEKHGQATVVTPFYPNADDAAFPFPILRYPSLDTTKLVGYRAGVPFAPELVAELEKRDFTLIHSHCPIVSTMLARTLRESIHAPLVFTYHTKFDIDIANAIRSKLLQEEAAAMLAANISACDEVWTVSRGAGENLRALGYAGDYRVMPNGVDFPRGRVDEALIAEVTADCDLPAGVPVFLFVGRMMWYKGVRIILDALRCLLDGGRDFRMVFVGAGGDKEEIMAYSASLGLDGHVIFTEPIRDRERIRAWYCRADLFLFPSTFDTNGLVVREAAACALGSVLVAGSCAAEDVEDGVSGFLIEENAESMAAKLLELLEAPEAMRRVGAGAQERIYVSWESAVAAACERYGAVIENYKSGRYPAHDGPSDDFFRGMAAAAELRAKRRQAQEQLLEDVRRGRETLRGEMAEQSRRFSEQWEKKSQELNDQWELQLRRLNERWELQTRRLNEELEKLTQFTDRFL